MFYRYEEALPKPKCIPNCPRLITCLVNAGSVGPTVRICRKCEQVIVVQSTAIRSTDGRPDTHKLTHVLGKDPAHCDRFDRQIRHFAWIARNIVCPRSEYMVLHQNCGNCSPVAKMLQQEKELAELYAKIEWV